MRSPTFTHRGFGVASPSGSQLGWSALPCGNVSIEGFCDSGENMADLYIDYQALADFAGQLRGLSADFSTPILSVWQGVCDASILDELTSLSTTDRTCGGRLNSYLQGLAKYADQAAQAAEKADNDIAQAAPSVPHGRLAVAF